MKVKVPGFAVDQRHAEPAGDAYLASPDKARQVIVAGRIEKAKKPGTAKNIREYFGEEIKNNLFQMDDIKVPEFWLAATVMDIIREHRGIPPNSRSMQSLPNF